MPKATPPDVVAAILATYDDTKNMAETMRRHPGTPYRTVQNLIYRARSACLDCRQPVKTGHVHCAPCRLRLAKYARERLHERQRLGLCTQCDEPISRPASSMYCTQHAEAVRANKRAFKSRQAAVRKVHGGLPTSSQRLSRIRLLYGDPGVRVWERDGGACCMCGITYRERAVHIHHLDGDHGNSVEPNMACLCQACHRLCHLLTEHPDLPRALAWLRSRYPIPTS